MAIPTLKTHLNKENQDNANVLKVKSNPATSWECALDRGSGSNSLAPLPEPQTQQTEWMLEKMRNAVQSVR